MKVNEIFKSIEGEGINSGLPTTFIRLQGCNLRCSYCDTRYACEGRGKEKTVDEILQKVSELGCKRITLTGGEPLFNEGAAELITVLLAKGYKINLETNGSIDIKSWIKEPNMQIIMDFKSISSGMTDKMHIPNLQNLRTTDAIKFVVGSLEDLMQMQQILKKYQPKCQIFVSPIYKELDPQYIVHFLLENELYEVRLQLQLHKNIWHKNQRGV